MPPKKKAKKTQTASLDKRAQAKMLRDKASALEAEETAEETPKKGVSEKFKKKVLELFDKKGKYNNTIPTDLKKIEDEDYGFTYECTKFWCKNDVTLWDCTKGEWPPHNLEDYKKTYILPNEEEYLRKLHTKNGDFKVDDYPSTEHMEGKIFQGKKCILKWSCKAYCSGGGITEGTFGSQEEFKEELKFDGDVPDCITDDLEWIEDFILDEMWRPLLVSKGHAPNRRDDRNILFGYACFDNNWLVKEFECKWLNYKETNPHKQDAWLNATIALSNIEKEIESVEDVKNVKGIGKSSLAFVEELLERRKKM